MILRALLALLLLMLPANALSLPFGSADDPAEPGVLAIGRYIDSRRGDRDDRSAVHWRAQSGPGDALGGSGGLYAAAGWPATC
jgi:hypothetical protein